MKTYQPATQTSTSTQVGLKASIIFMIGTGVVSLLLAIAAGISMLFGK